MAWTWRASSFLVAGFCTVDVLLAEACRGRKPRRRGPAPVLADSEVLTIEVVGEAAPCAPPAMLSTAPPPPNLHRMPAHHSQMSLVQSPPGYRISCALAGPLGSLPKSTKKPGLMLTPPFSVSQSIWTMQEPC